MRRAKKLNGMETNGMRWNRTIRFNWNNVKWNKKLWNVLRKRQLHKTLCGVRRNEMEWKQTEWSGTELLASIEIMCNEIKKYGAF